MGLIKAFAGSISGTLADQWKEYFYCEALPVNVLARKGQKRVNGWRSSNTKGSENIISDGSIVVVADGQCMMIVNQGKVQEFAAEPGAYKVDNKTESSIFAGNFGAALAGFFKTFARRFTFGGDTGSDQRVYYFNTKEIVDNKFGTPNPVPFRIVDNNVGLDIDVNVRCNGVYSYKIANPMLFYTNVCGNMSNEYTRDQLDGQLKTEFIAALQPGFGRLSEKQLRPNQIMTHLSELESAMNEALDEKWGSLRGLEVVSIALGSVTLPKEDEDLIKELQRKAVYAKNSAMAGATLVEAQAEAMKAAAGNANGAAMGFYGLNMAANAGGMNAGSFYDRAESEKKASEAANSWTCSCGTVNTGKFCANCGQPKPAPAGSWKCPNCGHIATGKFCPECGKPKPVEEAGWTCECGTVNTGKFCANCGKPRPSAVTKVKCNKCGWEAPDPAHPPKFCPECGDPINDEDKK
ncbi:MAG: SPFH domain-containing protein [Bacilli bacterium]|nr:SPFH domain-containing protein [Bacilli bacterium]